MEGTEIMGNDTVRLKYQAEPGSVAVAYGREINVKMHASRKQKIKVTRVRVIMGRKFLGLHIWPLS